MFYVLLATRARSARATARLRDARERRTSPSCSTSSRSAPSPTWCSLDQVNRIFVEQGLRAHPRRPRATRRARAVRGRGPRRAPRHGIRFRLCRRPAPQRRGTPRRHVAGNPLPAGGHHRRGDGAGAASSIASTASVATSKRRCRKRRWPTCDSVGRCAGVDQFTLLPLPRRVAPGRGRHRRVAPQGAVPPAGDRVRARRRRRTQGLRPLDRRLPFA